MRAFPALVVLLVLGVAGCGGGSDDGAGPSPSSGATSNTSAAAPSTPSTSSTSGPSDADTIAADRDAASSAAADFMTEVNTYGPGDLAADGTMPGYADRVVPLVTATFRTAFERNVTLAERAVAEAGYARSVTLVGRGVAVLGADAATVLVAGTLQSSRAGTDGGAGTAIAPEPFRVQVSVVRTGTTWRVDDFGPVDGPGPGLAGASGDRVEDDAAAARGAVVAGLPQVLGYDYRTLDDDRTAALAVLTPAYAEEFERTFDTLVDEATSSQAVVTATVVAAGVTTVADDRVDVLVFVDQTTRTDESAEPVSYANQVTASLVLVDGSWLVDALTTT